MRTAFHPDFERPVNYSIESLPESSDGQVAATISKMLRYIRADRKSPFIQMEVEKMLALGGGDPNQGLWKLVKPSMRFKRDERIADDLVSADPRISDTIEVLIRPADQWLLIQMRGLGIGDCDCFSMYGGCLLFAAGVPCSLVTVDADEQEPGIFSHVYLASYYGGVRTALDLSHGEYPGWECPNGGRVQEWPIDWTMEEHLSKSALAIGGLVGIYFGVKWLGKAA